MKETHKIFDGFSLANSKAINEVAVAEIVLERLRIDAASLKSAGNQDPPDCILKWENSTLGIEVVAMIDDDARRLNASVRERQSDKDNLDWTKEFYADWTQDNFRSKICEIVNTKDNKILKARLGEKAAADCSLFWLIIHADEAVLTSNIVQEYLESWKVSTNVFEKVFVILPYEPGRKDNGYPLFLLS